jgi:ribosome-associated translation inhibitor RaiA
MSPFVMVRFHGTTRQPSLEAAAQRWVARLELVHVTIQRAVIDIEAQRKATRVQLTVALDDGAVASITSAHEDPYVAIADAFRAVRRNAATDSQSEPTAVAV